MGAKRIRYFDETWPAPGSEFHHTVGFGPVAPRDRTTIAEGRAATDRAGAPAPMPRPTPRPTPGAPDA